MVKPRDVAIGPLHHCGVSHRGVQTPINCIGIRLGGDGYGLWRLTSGRGASEKTETEYVRGNLVTNEGAIAVK
jgi:hypothetical protein